MLALPLARAALLLCLLGPAASSQTSAPPEPAFRRNPQFLSEVAAAHAAGQDIPGQITHWKAAANLSGAACAECSERIATLSFRIGEYPSAIEAARSFERLSPLPADKAYAELLCGSALLHLHDDKPTLLELDQADTTLKSALEHNPALRSAAYLDGRALAALHRDTEARGVFRHYAETAAPDDPYRARAEIYATDIRLARATMAPPFAVTTADGKHLTLDDLRGRVVLLDFWATWCVPCKEFLPRLKDISAKFAAEPFTLISVSRDDDESLWRAFVAENGMTWPQFLDRDKKFGNAYGVDSLPHYFTIDAEGVLQSEVIGLGADDLEARLRKLIDEAKTRPSAPRKINP